VACCDIFSGETSSVKDLCSGNEYHYEWFFTCNFNEKTQSQCILLQINVYFFWFYLYLTVYLFQSKIWKH
jgi:hypothetical protein